MVEQIAKRILSRIKAEVSAFLDVSEKAGTPASASEKPGEIISEIRGHLGKLIAEDHQIQKQITASEEALAQLKDKVELAIDQDRDDLARAVIIQRKGLERQIAGYKARQQEIELESLEIEDLIQSLSDEEGAEDGDAVSGAQLNKQLSELEALTKRKKNMGDTN